MLINSFDNYVQHLHKSTSWILRTEVMKFKEQTALHYLPC